MLRETAPLPTWLAVAFVGVFLLFSAHFLYFFVDDEAITFVYARNLVRGDGLIYNHIEPRAEGYSNFLHVLVASLIFAAVRGFGWPLETVFFLGKAFSAVCGAGLVLLVAHILRQRPDMTRAAATAALATIALAGPVALWSASSLETVPFALMVLLFACRLWNDPDQVDWIAIAAGVAVLLWRIDGFVYIGLVLGPAILLASPERAWPLTHRYALPLAALFVAYTACRWLYFGALLSEPLATKVLYKLQLQGELATKEAVRGYLARFLDEYGWISSGAVVVTALLTARDRWTMRLLATTLLIVGYIAIVGDWMYGFRFFVTVLPLYAILVAVVVAKLGRSMPAARVALPALLVAWAAASGVAFGRTYMTQQDRPSGLLQPSADPRLYFLRFWDVYQFLRPTMRAGTVTANNQAGFVPFMLDLENIDDIGLCSRFVARLPTVDVFFTEAGRYSPLTPAHVLRTTEAYILYNQVAAVIEPADLLRSANLAAEPQSILAGRYALAYVDPRRTNAVYLPSGGPPAPFRDRRGFLENVAHRSRLRSVRVDGQEMPPTQYGDQLAFLAGIRGWTTVKHARHLAVVFDTTDVPVYEVYIGDIRSDRPVEVTVTLSNSSHQKAWEGRLQISTTSRRRHWRLDSPVEVSHLALTFDASDQIAHVRMSDMRLQGQSHALRDYLDATLTDLRP
jgi:arabinofuranosyltransferase